MLVWSWGGGDTLEAYMVVERHVLERVESSSILTGLIAAYFAFNMTYPKALYAVLICIQHFLGISKSSLSV